MVRVRAVGWQGWAEGEGWWQVDLLWLDWLLMAGEKGLKSHAGHSLSGAGHVTTEGLMDVIVGAYQKQSDCKSVAGKSDVVH